MAWIMIYGKRKPRDESFGTPMLDPPKTLEREALLNRIRELDVEIPQHERNLCEGEARLPIEEQLSPKLRRFIEANIPELSGKIKITSGA